MGENSVLKPLDINNITIANRIVFPAIRAESNGNGSTFHITLPKLAPLEGEWDVQPCY